jgi:hypothetical protein
MISLFLSINLIIVSSLENNNTLVGVTTKYNIEIYQKSTLWGGIIKIMATGQSSNYPTMKYPLASDPVNVHGDIKVLVDALNDILPPLGYGAAYVNARNVSGSTINQGTPVFINGNMSYGGSMISKIEKYNPSSPSHNADVPILGLAKTNIANGDNGLVIVSGALELNTTGLGPAGTKVYVDENGSLVGGRPSTGPARYVAVVAVQHTMGMLIIQTKGNGTWGALKDGLS